MSVSFGRLIDGPEDSTYARTGESRFASVIVGATSATHEPALRRVAGVDAFTI